ncbi:hypothetical protein ABIE50_005399 [Chitinophaga sp. OAE865]
MADPKSKSARKAKNVVIELTEGNVIRLLH